MKIVILDGYAANPGDLSWHAFHALGSCEIYDRTPAAEVVARAKEADIVLTNKTALSAETIRQLPRLKYVGVLATGYNVVDVPATRERGITVTNIPGYGTRAVAQHAMALILELSNQVGLHAKGVREGGWSKSPDWCYWEKPLTELDGLNLGIIGFGRIGQSLAELGLAFGMKILAPSHRQNVSRADVAFVPLDELFRESDVLSLHCPLTPDTQALINVKTLALMKLSVFLVNTARGGLIDEEALCTALQNGKIAGAALDVLSAEPPPADHPLLTAPNCIITPHQSWATGAARARLLRIAAENVQAFLAGKPLNVV